MADEGQAGVGGGGLGGGPRLTQILCLPWGTGKMGDKLTEVPGHFAWLQGAKDPWCWG